MRDHGTWSVSLGRWGGVQVRLHMFFLLFAVCTVYLSWHAQRQHTGGGLMTLGLLSLAILFFSVLLHEVGHCYAAWRLGGFMDQMVLGPLGGLAPVRMPHDPRRKLTAHLAGPLVNLILCLACLPSLLIAGVNVLGLLNPFAPVELISGTTWLAGLKLTFWINWLLLLINLLPAFPFDGGRILRALLMMISTGVDQRGMMAVAAIRLAQFTAVGLLVVAWLMRNADPVALVPAWFALMLMAIFVFFCARQEGNRYLEDEVEDDPFGYDFSEGYTSLERDDDEQEPARTPTPGPLGRWLQQRQEANRHRQAEIESEEDRRMDAILARLHETGIKGLSAEEQSLLNRVSARYRSRSGR